MSHEKEDGSQTEELQTISMSMLQEEDIKEVENSDTILNQPSKTPDESQILILDDYASQTSVAANQEQNAFQKLRNSVFASRYLQSNSPRLDYVNEMNQVIEGLQKELKDKEMLIQQSEKDKISMMQEFEKKVEDTRRETRDKVQKVMERRINKITKEQAIDKSPKNTSKSLRHQNHSSLTSRTMQRKVDLKEETQEVVQSKRMSTSAQRTRNQVQNTPSFNQNDLKSLRNQAPMPDQLQNLPAPMMLRNDFGKDPTEMTFKSVESSHNIEKDEIRAQLAQEYEDKFRQRIAESQNDITKQVRETLENDLRIEYMGQLKFQRDAIRKELQIQMQNDLEERVMKEVDHRLHENLIQWEDDYKQKHINQLQELISENLRLEYEARLSDILDRERHEMNEECNKTIQSNIEATKEEAERVLNDKVQEISEQFDNQLELERQAIREECTEDLRSEKEQQLQMRLKDKITKRIENELYQTMPKLIEERLRGQIEEKIVHEIQEENIKQINMLKRKLELQVDERSSELSAKLQRDFDNEVRKRSDEIALRKEKEVILKYRSQYEREKKSVEIKLQKDFNESLKEVREQLDRERNEVARLKSLEQIRLRKLGEQKQQMKDQLNVEKMDLLRERKKIEIDAKQRRIKDWEMYEDRKAKETRDISASQTMKVLEDDQGCEQVSKSYHIANTIIQNQQRGSTSKSPQRHQYREQQNMSGLEILSSPIPHNITEIIQEQQRVCIPLQQRTVDQNYKREQQQSKSPAKNLIDKIKLASADYLNCQMIKGEVNLPLSQQNDHQTSTSTITPRINSPEQEYRANLFIKPCDSRQLVQQLLKESIEKFQLNAKIGGRASLSPFREKENYVSVTNIERDSNQLSTNRSNYEQALSRQSSHSNLSKNQTCQSLQPHVTTLVLNKDFKHQTLQWLKNDHESENHYFEYIQTIMSDFEQQLVKNGMSDHGMFEYLIDLWDQLMISYQSRMQFLENLQSRDSKQIYRLLESETSLLTDFRNETQDIYSLIKRKETSFGNFFTQRYHQVEHKSELFSLRADLIRKIEDFQKKKNAKQMPSKKQQSFTILWRGVPYIEICKMEKLDIENKLKEDIREELEAKKMKRGTTSYSTYNRLMV